MTTNVPANRENKDLSVKKDINKEHDLSIIEQVVMQGDLSKLTATQRVTYYHKVCESIGLNPYTRPFDYISLNGKLTLYAKKDATEQLRQVKKISIVSLEGKMIDDLYVVTAKASTPDGRIDQSTGAVSIGNLKGEQKANALMKCETKAKRRVTLSIAGMGWTDESEIESIPNAQLVNVDTETGEIIECKADLQVQKEPISHEAFRQLMSYLNVTDEEDNAFLKRVMKHFQIGHLQELECHHFDTVVKRFRLYSEEKKQKEPLMIEQVKEESAPSVFEGQ